MPLTPNIPLCTMKRLSRTISPNRNRKNPRAHKKKISTSSPPQKTKIPPPLKREFCGHGGFPEKDAFFQACMKLAQPFPAPELRTRKFTDTWIFLKKTLEKKNKEKRVFVNPFCLLLMIPECARSFLQKFSVLRAGIFNELYLNQIRPRSCLCFCVVSCRKRRWHIQDLPRIMT